MKRFLLLLVLVAGLSAQANEATSPVEGFQATNFNSMEELMPIWRSIKGKRYLKNKTNCYDRAHAWSYDLHKQYGILTKKMIIHFSARYMDELNGGWSWHVAPMVTVNGEDVVLDKQFFDRPVPRAEWIAFFIKHGVQKLEYERTKLVNKIKNAQWKIDEIRADRGRWYWGSASSYRSDIYEYRRDLRKLGLSETEPASITCKRISHIEELDYAPNSAWCFTQEASMYYHGLPQLRLLNYGTSNMRRLPLRHYLPQAREAGRRYKVTQWDPDVVWESKDRAFEDADELWYIEHRQYEHRKEMRRRY